MTTSYLLNSQTSQKIYTIFRFGIGKGLGLFEKTEKLKLKAALTKPIGPCCWTYLQFPWEFLMSCLTPIVWPEFAMHPCNFQCTGHKKLGG